MWKKTKLPGSEDVINSEMLEDVFVDESFKEFTNNWLKGDRTVVRSRLAVTRFKDWYDTGQLPCTGNTSSRNG